MFDGLMIGDRVKLEHIKSGSFVDSVVVDYDDEEFRWIELPGDVMFWKSDGWEVVS